MEERKVSWFDLLLKIVGCVGFVLTAIWLFQHPTENEYLIRLFALVMFLFVLVVGNMQR